MQTQTQTQKQQQQQQPAPPPPHPKLQQQHSLPLLLQYHHHSSQQTQVTTTQPSPAGTFINQAGIINSSAVCGYGGNIFGSGIGNQRNSNASGSNNLNGGDISPTSSTNSFSSVDTNQTLMQSIVAQKQQQLQQQQQQHNHKKQARTSSSSSAATKQRTASSSSSTNRSYRTKYSQFMIITPAVSIDRDFERESNYGNGFGGGGIGNSGYMDIDSHVGDPFDDDDPYFNNGNIFRMGLLQHSQSIDSGNSSDSGGCASNSFHSNYNPYLHTSRQHLLPKAATPHFYSFSSWRWCTLICAAMRCFGAGKTGSGGGVGGGRANSCNSRLPYQSSRGGSKAPYSSCTTGHLRYSNSFTAENAFEHFSAPFGTTSTPRKTRDHLNNITYEL